VINDQHHHKAIMTLWCYRPNEFHFQPWNRTYILL